MTRTILAQRFWIFPAIQLWTIVSLLIGGNMIFTGYSTVLLAFIIADLFTDELKQSDDVGGRFDRIIPEISLFFHVLVFSLSAWRIAQTNIGDANDVALAIFISIQAGAMAVHNTVVISHELMHRGNGRAFLLAQFLAAFSFRTSGVIDHVYGHHVLVGLREDNVTARLNEGFWRYLFRTIPNSNKFSIRFEADRLRRKSVSAFSIRNRQIQGWLCYLPIVALAVLIGGIPGLAFLLASSLYAMVLVEAGNYIAHYGLVREPGEEIAETHSWNNYNTLSSSLLLNLPRHSDHHLHASRNYWSLTPAELGPKYPMGFLAMTVIALLPPLFFKLVHAQMDAQDISRIQT